MSIRIQVPNRQSGAVLVVSLILLFVLTILAVSMSQTTRLQERMAGNVRDADLAFQAAEAGLRDGEDLIDESIDLPITCASPAGTPGCIVYELGALDLVDLRTDETFWESNRATEYGVTGQRDLGNVDNGRTEADPRYVVEYIDEIADDENLPPVITSRRYFYRVTSRGTGGTEQAQAVLETTFAERF